jgi:thiamine-phosphate pyrophosphorylase
MNDFEAVLGGQLGATRLQRLQQVKVGIAGAGGLGSNCAVCLVRSGFRQLVLADHDVVEVSNLNRQFYFGDQIGLAKVEALRANLLRINPDLDLTVKMTKITPANLDECFGDCQAVVEALDQAETKRLLLEHFWQAGKLIVAASGIAGWDDADQLATRQIKPHLYLVGDQKTAVGEDQPPLAPRVTVAAAKEANVILKWVLEGCRFATIKASGVVWDGEGGGTGPGSSLHLEKAVESILVGARKRRWLETDLYGITAVEYSRGRSNVAVVREMLAAGIKLIQYREKERKLGEQYRECLEIRQLTRDYDAGFIVNDHLDLALAVDADGVHLGQDDLPVEQARRLAGAQMLIGLSTHSPEQAQAAVQAGADYIGVGPIFKTATKKDVCDPVGLGYLDYVAAHHAIGQVAIGGIKETNVAEVVRHGARCIAMVTEIVGAPDIGAKVRAIRVEITKAKEHMK